MIKKSKIFSTTVLFLTLSPTVQAGHLGINFYSGDVSTDIAPYYSSLVVGNTAPGSVSFDSGQQYNTKTHIILGNDGRSSSEGTLTVRGYSQEGTPTKITTNSYYNGLSGVGTTLISNGGQIQTDWMLNGTRHASTGTLNVYGTGYNNTPSLLSTKNFRNGANGFGYVTLSNGGQIKVSGLTFNGDKTAGTINIRGTSNNGIPSSFYTKTFFNAYNSSSSTSISGGGYAEISGTVYNGYERTNGTLNIEGTSHNNSPSKLVSNVFYNGYSNRSYSHVTIKHGGEIQTIESFFNGYNSYTIGTLTVQGTSSRFLSKNFYNGDQGSGNVILSYGGQILIQETAVIDRRYSNRYKSTLLIDGKNHLGTASKFSADSFYNGKIGYAETTISNGGQLTVNSVFSQNSTSALKITLSSEYLDQQNDWIITGNNTDDDIENDGINTVELDGILTILNNENFTLENFQYINFMQIASTIGNRTGYFKNFTQNSSIGYFESHELFISYFGGDGNDIVFYTIPEPTSIALLIMGALAGLKRRKK